MRRPFADKRVVGPLFTFNSSGNQYVPEGQSEARDWKNRDTTHTDNLKAPESWDWQIGDELAHYVWQLSSDSDYVVMGPDPPILLEAFMAFFPDEGMSSQLNSWYYTRKQGREYEDEDTWWQIGSQFSDPEGDADLTSILYSVEEGPHPLRSKLHSQQYTSDGGMFTYDFTQWQGELPTGMMRIPVDRSLLHDLRSMIEPTPFEEFEMQSRPYSLGAQYVDEIASGTYAHPHFRAESETTVDDYKQLFDIAFDFMKRSVEVD